MGTGSRREILSKEEGVVTASGLLGESVDGSADGGTPEMIVLGIVPIGDE